MYINIIGHFLNGRDSVLDDERPGRNRIICKKLIKRIANVMESDGRVTVAELASMFDIGYGTAFSILTEYLDMREFCQREASTKQIGKVFRGN